MKAAFLLDLWANFYKTIYMVVVFLYFSLWSKTFSILKLENSLYQWSWGWICLPLWAWQEAELWVRLENILSYLCLTVTAPPPFMKYLTLGNSYDITKPEHTIWCYWFIQQIFIKKYLLKWGEYSDNQKHLGPHPYWSLSCRCAMLNGII